MHTKQLIIATMLASSLAACGGGGSSGPTSAQNAAIDSALTNIVQTLPKPAKTFLGAFASVNGVSVGYIEGTDEGDVAKKLALAVAQNQDKFPNEYKSMLSDAGMAITVYGDITGTTKFGTVASTPDVHYVARMGKGNVIDLVMV